MSIMKPKHKLIVSVVFTVMLAIIIYLAYHIKVCPCEIGNVRF
jgi:hypothetical protein